MPRLGQRVRTANLLWTCLSAALLFAAPALAQGTACGVGPDMLKAVAATHTLPPYPPESIDNDEQGVTLVRVRIAPDGVPKTVWVETSSGSARLDQAAVDHIRDTWRWNSWNCPQDRITRVSLRWNLQYAHRTPDKSAPLFPAMTHAREIMGLILGTAVVLLSVRLLFKPHLALTSPIAAVLRQRLNDKGMEFLAQAIGLAQLFIGFMIAIPSAMGLLRWLGR